MTRGFGPSGEKIGIDVEQIKREFPARRAAPLSVGRFFLPLTPFCRRSDDDILRSASGTLLSIMEVPTDYVEVRVANGWITLSGTVDWQWQRELVVNAMRRVVGVTGVGDGIELRPDWQPEARRPAATPPSVASVPARLVEA